MPINAWVLVQTEVGKARSVADTAALIQAEGVNVLACDTVTGPHDVILRLQADNLDAITLGFESQLEAIPGVEHTITCLTIHPS